MPAKLAARQLKLREGTVRRSIQEKFHAALRRRTPLRVRGELAEDHSIVLNGETRQKGLSHEDKVSKMKPDQISWNLRHFTKEPQIEADGNEKYVRLTGGTASLIEIRSFLAENEELCDELVEAGVPLGWVLRMMASVWISSQGEIELVGEIERIASREWSVAVFVGDECVKNLGDRKLPELSERSATDEPVARIAETLEGLSVALLRTIDAPLRQKRPPLCIWQADNTIYGRWEGGPPQFDLPPFVLRQAMRFGEFHHDAGTIVANTVSALLASGALPLPGFDLEKPSGGLQILRPQPAGLR
jgi:hypothetical protein